MYMENKLYIPQIYLHESKKCSFIIPFQNDIILFPYSKLMWHFTGNQVSIIIIVISYHLYYYFPSHCLLTLNFYNIS